MNKKSEMVLSYLNQLSFEKNQLTEVMIELLTQCNLACEHCYLPQHNNRGLSTDIVKKLLNDLRREGVITVSFTGGEIFLRNDLFELIEEARKHYMRVFLLSNATLINREKAKRLRELNVAQVSTTLFSLNPEIHDLISGVNGSQKRAMQGISFLKEFGVPVNVKMPIMKYNADDVKDLADFCKKNSFDFLASPNIFARNDGDKTPKLLQVEDEKLYEIVKYLDESQMGLEYGDVNKYRSQNQADVPCIAIFSSMAIDSLGDVYPCNSFLYKVGNIFNNSINHIWNESEKLRYLKSIKNDMTKCCDCEFVAHCTRCPGLALAETNSMYGCDSFARKLAQIRSSYQVNV